MNLASLLPEIAFTNTELHELALHLTQPVVKKYFKSLQAEALKDIGNGLPKEGESAESYIRRQAVIVGSLQATEALLAVEAPNQA